MLQLHTKANLIHTDSHYDPPAFFHEQKRYAEMINRFPFLLTCQGWGRDGPWPQCHGGTVRQSLGTWSSRGGGITDRVRHRRQQRKVGGVCVQDRRKAQRACARSCQEPTIFRATHKDPLTERAHTPGTRRPTPANPPGQPCKTRLLSATSRYSKSGPGKRNLEISAPQSALTNSLSLHRD